MKRRFNKRLFYYLNVHEREGGVTSLDMEYEEITAVQNAVG